jgi:RNA polymerase sigma-70 factor (ECF subfamily)
VKGPALSPSKRPVTSPSNGPALGLPHGPVAGSSKGHADLALAERCRTNAPGAFEELYRAHAPRLFGVACRLVGRTEAEDLLQDIFLTAHRKLTLFKGESSLGTWLFRLATNLCLDHLRSRSARFAQVTDVFEGETDAAGASAGAIVGVVDRLDLERALASLPAGCRAVFVLHDVEGCEHREIASLLGISDGTSKSQLHKARMRLRAKLGHEGHEGVKDLKR